MFKKEQSDLAIVKDSVHVKESNFNAIAQIQKNIFKARTRLDNAANLLSFLKNRETINAANKDNILVIINDIGRIDNLILEVQQRINYLNQENLNLPYNSIQNHPAVGYMKMEV